MNERLLPSLGWPPASPVRGSEAAAGKPRSTAESGIPSTTSIASSPERATSFRSRGRRPDRRDRSVCRPHNVSTCPYHSRGICIMIADGISSYCPQVSRAPQSLSGKSAVSPLGPAAPPPHSAQSMHSLRATLASSSLKTGSDDHLGGGAGQDAARVDEAVQIDRIAHGFAAQQAQSFFGPLGAISAKASTE